MRQIGLLILLMVGLCVGTPSATTSATPRVAPEKERPTVNLPVDMRQTNWTQGSGRCVHATTISLFRWQGRYDMADHWRKTYGGSEYPTDMAAKLDKEGVRYAYTAGENDVKFLEWAIRTRRGCGVTVMGGAHFVTLVELTDTEACIMDNNSVQKYQWQPREKFLSEWKSSNSWALCILYTPAAPLP